MTRVEEPSKYGVIVYQEKSGQIDRFVEKPQEYVGNKINAGLYLFSANILKWIPVARFDRRRQRASEKEIFPAMAADSQLHAYVL